MSIRRLSGNRELSIAFHNSDKGSSAVGGDEQVGQSSQAIDPNRDSRLRAQFLRSRSSMESLRLQSQIKARVGASMPVRDLPEPPLLPEDQNASDVVLKRPDNGGLFINGVKASDVLSGEIDDNYLMAELAAVAKAEPSVIRQAIHDNGDGTYTVRLYDYDNATGESKPQYVLVDSRFATFKNSNELVYGHSPRNSHSKIELWPAILEKAIATVKGGYQNITGNFYSQDAMSMITGTRSNLYGQLSFNRIAQFVKSGHPMTVIPNDDHMPGLINGYSYTVLGTEVKNGEQFITLRNPAGSSEPGNDGTNDGIFQISYQDFQKHFYFTKVGRTRAEENRIQNYRTLAEPALGKLPPDFPAVTYQRAEDVNLIPSLFGDQVKATDVATRGILNDSAVVAAFSSLAKTNPDAIKRAIRDNHDGTYTVRLYDFKNDKATPRFVTVDSKFPMFTNNPQPLYAQSPYNGAEITLWPTILEKAIASSYGGYDKIENNFPTGGTVLAMLTGKSSNVDPNNFFNFEDITYSVKGNHAIMAATNNDDYIPYQDFQNAHLLPNFSYSIVDAGTDENGKQFVTLRDPRGPFSDVGNDQGIIKLSYDDFKKFFANLSFSDL